MEDQRRERQCRGLHADPQEGEVVAHADERGAGEEREQAADERAPAAWVLAAQIAHGIGGHDHEEQAYGSEHHKSERIERQPAVEHRRRRIDPRLTHEREVQHGHRDEPGGAVGHRTMCIGADGAEHRQEHHREQHHHSWSSVRRAESSESNSRLM
jgi:hypothetical protein